MVKRKMKIINFNTLEEAIECYGRENLVAIDCIRQIIFYTKHGCQPKYVAESQNNSGKLTCWFLKQETKYVYSKWMQNAPDRR